MSISNLCKHIRTISHHKALVGKLCFKVGLYKRGLLHDLSKYTPTELKTGARYFQGDKSPNAAERLDKGYSEAWLHHKGRNKHHFEYWMDIDPKAVREGRVPEFVGMPMPTCYVVEMFCDRVAACMVYQGDDYTDASALEYLTGHENYSKMMHPDTMELLTSMLSMLAEKGEQETFAYIRENIVKPRLVYGENGRWK